MIKKFSLIAFFMSVIYSYGQNGTITGIVVSKNNEPISEVNITLQGTNKGTTTNNEGIYRLTGLQVGSYTVKASFIGYKTKTTVIQVLNNQTHKVAQIVLQKKQEQLNEIVLEGTANNYVVKDISSSLRLQSKLIKLPQNIQVISGALIKDQQSFTMMESVARNVSGAQMIEHWGQFARINMRGFRVAPFRNGVNTTFPWGPLSEDMSMVERIEFVKGPAGFMLAAGEPGGLYNVVTKKPKKEKIAELSFTTGSFNTYRGTVDLGSYTSNGKLQYRLTAMAQSEESHRDFEKSSRVSIVPSIKYDFTNNTALTAEFTYQQSSLPTGAAYIFAPTSVGFASLDKNFAMLDDNYPNTDIEELGYLIHFSHKLNDHWKLQAQQTIIRFDQEGYFPWPAAVENNGDVTRALTSGDAIGYTDASQLFLTGNFITGSISHKILAGFDYNSRAYWADWNQGGDLDTTPFNIFNPVYGNATIPEIDRSQSVKIRGAANYQGVNTRGYYVQDEIGFIENKLRLTLAGRYTNAHIFAYGQTASNSKFTPRIGLSYDILPDFSVYGLFDQAFLPQYGASRTGQLFDPEEAKDIEGGLKKSWFNGKLNTSLAVYQITKNNLLVSDPEDINFSIQLGEVISKGIEFDMQGQLTPELNVILNYANTNVEDNDGNKIAGHSKHITNAWLNYNFKAESNLKGFGVSLGYQYQVDRSTWAWGVEGNTPNLPDYFRMDGALSWQNEKFNIRLNVNNLLNEYLYSGTAYATYLYWQSEPGTNGRLSITYKF